MGNAITKKFDVPKDHTASAGHHQFWKIWPGKSKETGELVSIWAFDKSDLSKRKNNPISDKAVLEQIFQIMKKDFTIIKESILCSSVVRYIETIEESKTTIVFTTERIVCSLADIVNHFQGIETGFSSHEDFFEDYGAVSEMEISKGLLNLSEGLQYLHTVQRKLHLNLTPESVVICANGMWKLCGFGFNLTFIQGDQQRLASPYYLKASSMPQGVRLEPDLRYCGPEATDGGFNPPGIRYLTPASDVFSLGLLVYEMYKYNLKDIPDRNSHRCVVTLANNDVLQHHFGLDALKTLDFSFLPPGIAQLVVGLLQLNVSARLSTTDIINNQYFVTGSLAVLNTIESMHSRDVGTQSSQLIQLQGQLSNFSSRILYLNVLPSICKLCVLNPALWVYAMPLHVFMSQHVSKERYQQYAGPTMAKGLAVQMPTETQQAFLNNIQFIVNMFDREYFQANIVVLFCNALEKQNIFLQTLAMEKLADEAIRAMFDQDSLSERLMPKLCKEACRNPEPNIKVQALYILSLFSKQLSADFIAKNILPSLKYITDSERNASVSMCVVGNYEALSEHLGAEYIATAILPSIQPMLVDKSLDRQQFEMIVNLVKTLLKRLFDARTGELGLAPVSVGEMIGNTVVDPFVSAKALIAASKRNSDALSAGSNPVGPSYASTTTTLTPASSGGGYGVPPPVPSMQAPSRAPPPPPSKPAPALPSTPPPPPESIPAYSASSTSTTNGGGLFGGMNTIVSSSSTSNGISAYQSDFGKTNSASSAPAVTSYKSAFDAATGGLPSVSATPSVIDAGINPFATSNTASISSSAQSQSSNSSSNAAGKSGGGGGGFGWFSSSKSAPKPDDTYQPPVVPLTPPMSLSAMTPPPVSLNNMTQPPINSSSAGGIDDMDDFLSSFNKKPATASLTTNAPSAGNAFNVNNGNINSGKLGISSQSNSSGSGVAMNPGGGMLSIEEQIQQTQAQIAKLNTSGFGLSGTATAALPLAQQPTSMSTYGASHGIQQPMPGYSTAPSIQQPMPGYSTAPSIQQPMPGYSAAPNIQQPMPGYIAAPNIQQPMPGYSAAPNIQQPMPGYSAAPNIQQPMSGYRPQQAGFMPQTTAPTQQFGMQQSGQYGIQSQQQPQQHQQYGFNNMNSGNNNNNLNMGGSGFSSQSYNNHLQQQQQQKPTGGMYSQQTQQQQMGNSNSNRIGNLPVATGYQPPAAYTAPSAGTQFNQYQQQQQQYGQQSQQNKTGSAFDFLN